MTRLSCCILFLHGSWNRRITERRQEHAVQRADGGGHCQRELSRFARSSPTSAPSRFPTAGWRRSTATSKRKKIIPAILQLVDIAGLVRGASQGEGLGNQFLANIRNVDAILHVVRCFADADVMHVEGGVDPIRDIDTIDTELMLADLQSVEGMLERAQRDGPHRRQGRQAPRRDSHSLRSPAERRASRSAV